MIRRVLVVAMLSLASVACSGGDEPLDAQPVVSSLELPSQLVGLRLQQEDLGDRLSAVERPYVDSVAVFSLREGEILRATLQVARFNRNARPDDPEFRGSIASTIGGSNPVAIRVGDTQVQATRTGDQAVFVWFSGNGMFVLSVQQDFEFPRTLLRRLIDRELTL